MNPNMKTVLALSYRTGDIEAATEQRRRRPAMDETPTQPGESAGTAKHSTRVSFAVVRRLLPRSA